MANVNIFNPPNVSELIVIVLQLSLSVILLPASIIKLIWEKWVFEEYEVFSQ